MKKITIILSALLLVFVLSNAGNAGDFIGIGAIAPNFTLLSVDGDSLTLSHVIFDSGKVVLINFFAYN